VGGDWSGKVNGCRWQWVLMAIVHRLRELKGRGTEGNRRGWGGGAVSVERSGVGGEPTAYDDARPGDRWRRHCFTRRKKAKRAGWATWANRRTGLARMAWADYGLRKEKE
jgi:hypothetical protein